MFGFGFARLYGELPKVEKPEGVHKNECLIKK